MRPPILAALLLAMCANLSPAGEKEEGEDRFPAWTIAPFVGSIVFDGKLADYRWDTGPHLLLGIDAAARNDRLALGGRLWISDTSQGMVVPGIDLQPSVGLTGAQLFGEVRLVTVRSFRIAATGSAGLLHVTYSPNTMSFDVGGAAVPVEVEFGPMDEWIGGAGLGVRRRLTGAASLGIGVERLFFSFDTAHRSDAAIEERAETFGSWTTRLEVVWTLGR